MSQLSTPVTTHRADKRLAGDTHRRTFRIPAWVYGRWTFAVVGTILMFFASR